MPTKEGTRVIAISHSKDKELHIFGEGIYIGHKNSQEFEEKNQPVGILAELMLEEKGITNPCIQLDNGNIVWGCECWWGPVDSRMMKEQLENSQIIQIDINETRRKYREEENAG